MVARSAATGEMVGALLAEDSGSEPPAGLEQLSPKFDPIFDILGQLDAEYSSGQARRRGESVHLFLLGVALDHAGKGIAQQLVEECLANGRVQGVSPSRDRGHQRDIAASVPKAGVH